MRAVVANPPWPGEGYGARSNVRWPHRRGDKRLAFPIYLAYTTAVLKKEGFGVKGLDAVERDWGISDFVREIEKINPSVVFLEVSTPSIMYDLETAQRLKEVLPKTLVVLMGPHATHFHRDIIRDYSFVDACIRGEFEYSARDVCRSLKRRGSLRGIKGITFRDNGKVVINRERERIQNLDELPFPDREDFRIENYQQAFYSGKKAGLMISSRGCPFQCTYCLWPNTIFSHQYRMRSPKSVVDEIETLIRDESIDEVFFDDDEFTINRKKVVGICNEILERGLKIKWHCMGRVNTVDRELLSLMKRAGCYQIFYGLESGSQRVLDSMRKGITKKQMGEAIRLTKLVGMVAGGSFIFGMPEDDMGSVRETLKFAKELGADWVQFTLAAPFPGTEFYREVKEKGLLEIDSWADLDGSRGPIVRTERLSRGDLEGIIRKAYISYYTSPKIVWQNLKRIRSRRDLERVLRGGRSIISRVFYYRK